MPRRLASQQVSRMRIAVYSHSIAPSIDGVCRRFTALLHELVRQGHEVLLFTLEGSPEDLPPSLLDVVTLTHIFLPAYPEKKIGRPSVASLFRVLAAVRRHRPEVIHVTSDALSTTFALVGVLLGVPVVASFHTDLQDLLRSHRAAWVQLFLAWLKERLDGLSLDGLATTSLSFQRKLAAQGLPCEYVIRTAVDREVFSPSRRSEALRSELTFGDEQAFLCVYVGRLSREKRIDVVIDALRDLPNAYLAIVGESPVPAKFASLSQETVPVLPPTRPCTARATASTAGPASRAIPSSRRCTPRATCTCRPRSSRPWATRCSRPTPAASRWSCRELRRAIHSPTT